MHLESEAVWLKAQLDAERVSKCCEILFPFFPPPSYISPVPPSSSFYARPVPFFAFLFFIWRLALALYVFPIASERVDLPT